MLKPFWSRWSEKCAINPLTKIKNLQHALTNIREENAFLKQFNRTLMQTNAELNHSLSVTQAHSDQAEKRIQKLNEELNEIQSEFLILVNAKTMSRKEARAIKNHKTNPDQYPQGLKIYP